MNCLYGDEAKCLTFRRFFFAFFGWFSSFLVLLWSANLDILTILPQNCDCHWAPSAICFRLRTNQISPDYTNANPVGQPWLCKWSNLDNQTGYVIAFILRFIFNYERYNTLILLILMIAWYFCSTFWSRMDWIRLIKRLLQLLWDAKIQFSGLLTLGTTRHFFIILLIDLISERQKIY